VTAVGKAKPQVIDDEEHERVYDRVAAIDVAKDSGMVCTRLPHPSRPGARQNTVWTVRDLRDYTRTRTRLTQERTRCFQRLEKLLESALVKVSSVASKLTTLSAQDMIKAMIAGQRDPQVLASLARTAMRAKREELAEAARRHVR
jgi:hypothetical protein